mgnify:CR=1 FL=1
MWHPPEEALAPSGQAQAATEYNHAVLGKPTLPGWRARRTTRAHTARSRTEPPTARRSPVQRHPRGLETRCAVFPDSHAAVAPKSSWEADSAYRMRALPARDAGLHRSISNVSYYSKCCRQKCRAFAQCGFTGQSPKIPYKGQERAHKGSVSTPPPPRSMSVRQGDVRSRIF